MTSVRLADRIKDPAIGEGCGAELIELFEADPDRRGDPVVLASCFYGLLVPTSEVTPDLNRSRQVCPYCKGRGR